MKLLLMMKKMLLESQIFLELVKNGNSNGTLYQRVTLYSDKITMHWLSLLLNGKPLEPLSWLNAKCGNINSMILKLLGFIGKNTTNGKLSVVNGKKDTDSEKNTGSMNFMLPSNLGNIDITLLKMNFQAGDLNGMVLLTGNPNITVVLLKSMSGDTNLNI